MAQTLNVKIIGDASSYSRALRVASGETQTFSSTVSRMGKTAALAAGAAGVGLLTVAVKTGISEWVQSQRVTAQTEQVLKSTGAVAGVTAGHVKDLATAIMRKTGIDDEAVQSSENLLLGFTKIRNELGRGNQVFDRATRLVQDYAVRTGRSATSASIIFGKALNDPIKGLSALSRVGIQFTAGQKKQIEALVKSGNTMAAQKLILAELEKRYGGAAEAAGKTLPGKLAILREEFRNLAGRGVGVAIQKIEELTPTFEKIGQVIGSLMPILRPLATLIFDVLVTPMKVLADLLTGDFSAAWEAVKKPITDVRDLLAGFWDVVGPSVTKVGQGVADAITGAINAVTSNLANAYNAARDFGANILKGLQDGILGFADWVRDRAIAAIDFVKAQFTNAYNAAVDFGGKILSGMKAGILGFADWVGGRATAAIGFITDHLGSAFSAASNFGGKILGGMKAGIEGFADWVGGRMQAAIIIIGDKAGAVYAAAKGFGEKIIKGIQDGVGALVAWVAGKINAVIDIINGLIGAFNSIPFVPNIPKIGHVGGGGPPYPGSVGPASTPPPGGPGASSAFSGGLGGRTSNVTVHVHGDVTGEEIVNKVRRGLQGIGQNNSIDPLAAF